MHLRLTPSPATPPPGERPWGEAETPYAQLGGDEPTAALANAFYDRVEATSPVLHAMLPKDTRISRRKLYQFLSGWLGGPQLYVEQYGHPRLRQRHFPFAIGEFEADDWVRCMDEAMDEVAVPEPLKTFLHDRFHQVSHHMKNQ